MEIPEPFIIEFIKQETADVFTMSLLPSDKTRRLSFLPGQFNMLHQAGFGDVAISISGDPNDNTKWIHTIRAVGSVTSKLEKLSIGQTIGVRGPFGNPWPLQHQQQEIIIIAGGLGIAPLRPVIYYLMHETKHFQKVTLIYGTRTPDMIIYKNELKEWEHNGIHVEISVDQPSSDWHGNTGVLTALISKHVFNPGNTLALICGPEIMMNFAIRELLRKMVNPEHIFLSIERNMKCAVGFCGHCQFGPFFICKNGPVFSYAQLKPWLKIKEL